MRKVERAMIEALHQMETSGEGLRKISSNTVIDNYPDGLHVELFGNCIAIKNGDFLTVNIDYEKWRTMTTKSRLNALLRQYNLPNIIQRDHVWYWTDGFEVQRFRQFQINS